MKQKRVSPNELMDIIIPYGQWSGDKMSPRNLDAKEALVLFLTVYKSAALDREYLPSSIDHLHYISYLLPIRAALRECHYQRACNELGSLIHGEHILQKRIHINLVALLEEYLSGGAVNV